MSAVVGQNSNSHQPMTWLGISGDKNEPRHLLPEPSLCDTGVPGQDSRDGKSAKEAARQRHAHSRSINLRYRCGMSAISMVMAINAYLPAEVLPLAENLDTG